VETARSIRLEIYVLHNNRWEIHSNFTMDQRDECIEEAKRIDVSGQFGAVSVVREIYSKADNSSRESVIYHSPKLSTAPPVDTVISGGGGFVSEGKKGPTQAEQRSAAGGEKKEASSKKKSPKRAVGKTPPAKPSGDKPSKKKKKDGGSKDDISLSAILPKLSVILIISMLAAGALSYAVYYVLQYASDMDIPIDHDIARGILVAVFVLSFLSFFIPRAHQLLRGLKSGNSNMAPQMVMPTMAAPSLDPAPPPVVETPPTPEEEQPLFEEQLEAEPAVEEVAVAEPEEEPFDPYANDPAANDPAAVVPPSRAANDLSGELLKFVHDSLEPVAKSNHELNAFNKFGMTLFLAGAADYLAMQHRVPEHELTEVLSSQMQILGQSEALARGFCANIDEYLLDPRNQEMYQAGRATIAEHKKNPSSGVPLDKVLDDWNRPRQKEDAHTKQFVAVLFTDIVGSTALTQARGDDAAQLVVHAHDRVVREAIGMHGGREIKHTGDGIMATFPQITDSIVASQAIQKSCYYENRGDPGLGLGICIGINAGEPIHENNDIFGTPVQMAARVLSKAEGWEICVSSSVHDMCSGKGYSFSKKGDYELKGFDHLVPIFLCEWRTEEEMAPLPEPGQQVAAQ
jgi:adenylate cyclase